MEMVVVVVRVRPGEHVMIATNWEFVPTCENTVSFHNEVVGAAVIFRFCEIRKVNPVIIRSRVQADGHAMAINR